MFSLFGVVDTVYFIQAKAQNVRDFETRGYVERDTSWDYHMSEQIPNRILRVAADAYCKQEPMHDAARPPMRRWEGKVKR
jgi:hypothetical protein